MEVDCYETYFGWISSATYQDWEEGGAWTCLCMLGLGFRHCVFASGTVSKVGKFMNSHFTRHVWLRDLIWEVITTNGISGYGTGTDCFGRNGTRPRSSPKATNHLEVRWKKEKEQRSPRKGSQ